jgi:hypothetical protein
MEFSESDLNEMFDELVWEGHIAEGTPAYGVARQCLDRGFQSLSPAQQSVYEIHVAPHMKRKAEKREVEARRARWPE